MHVEDSLNSAGRSVSFHHPSADASLQKQWLIAIPLTNTPHQVKGRLCPPRVRRRGTSTGLSSNHRRRLSCRIPFVKKTCLTVGDLIFRD